MKEREEFFESSNVLKLLGVGKKRARTAETLYRFYKRFRSGQRGFDVFYRELRLAVEELRRQKYKIVGDNYGYYIAETSEEWERYVAKQRSRILNELVTLATASNRTVISLMKEWVMKKKDKPMTVETDLFLEAKKV